MLTTSVDTLVGTDSSDLFTGLVDTIAANSTLTALDSIDGGLGNDTLNILATTALNTTTGIAGLEVKNVETVTIKGSNTVTADTTTWTGTNTLNVTKATDATLTAAATTDVNVSGASGNIIVNDGKNVVVNDETANKTIKVDGAAGTITVTDTNNISATDTNNNITIDGGTDVTVTATGTANGTDVKSGNISIGATTQATGDVKVTQNINNDGTVASVAAGDIDVTGGKTVNVTVNSTITAKDKTATNGIANGDVTVNSDGKTTNVTVSQNSTVTEFVTPETAATAATQTVTFKALAANQNITLVGAVGQSLTFTASKALTAAEVAAAFANLTDGDIQANGGKTANGIYTSTNGGLKAGFTTGAVTSIDADNASVTFSTTTDTNAATAAVIEGQLITTTGSTPSKVSVAPEVVGKAAVPEAKTTDSGGNAVTYGDVTVEEDGTAAASITTVTLDGFKDANLGTTATKELNALTTLSIANSAGTTTLGTTKTALTLNVDNIIDSTTNLAAVDLDDAGANITTLTINANGEDSKFELTATKVETLTIAAAADLNISKSAPTGLAALKTVTITGAGDVNLGDISSKLETLTASAATGAISASVDGDLATVTTGSGDDSIVVKSATEVTKAITLGAGDDRLDLSTITIVVNATTTAAIAGGTGTDTVVLAATNANDTTGLSLLATSNIFKSKVTGFEKLEIVNNLTAANATVNVGNLGYNYVITNAVATYDLTLDDMANNGTVELNAAAAGRAVEVAVKGAATNNTDVLNVVLNVDAGEDHGTLTVDDVETIKITATDSTPVNPTTGAATIHTSTFDLDATSAKTVTITGNAHLDLDMALNTAATLIDGSTMTGDLKVTAYNAGMTVKGGAGNDTLSVVGAKSGVVLTGGKGTDTFDVSAFDANANAGAAVTITDLTAGETIQFADASKFVSSKITLISEATFTEYVAEAAKVANGEIAWFQFNNNTFVVQDGATGTDGVFDSGDIIVKINGLVDLSTASFNATTDTLVIA